MGLLLCSWPWKLHTQCYSSVPVPPGAYGSSQCCLKFWDLANASTRTGLLAPFTLNTRVDDPHAPGQISSLCCHPSADIAVTTGASDCEFRVWVRAASQRKPGGKAVDPSSWRCRWEEEEWGPLGFTLTFTWHLLAFAWLLPSVAPACFHSLLFPSPGIPLLTVLLPPGHWGATRACP